MSTLADDSTGYVAHEIRRATRNSLIANGIVFAFLALFAWLTSTYYYYFFTGPVAPSDDQVLALARDPGNGNLLIYAEFFDRPLIESGWKEVTTKDDRVTSESDFYFLSVRDQYLLVQAESVNERHLVGPISRVRALDQTVIDGIIDAHPEFRGRILPLMLHGKSAFRVAGYLGLILLGPIALICGYNLLRALRALTNHLHHRSVRRLNRYGDVSAIVRAIDGEMAAGSVMSFGRARLTSLWLIRPTVFGLQAFRLQDIVWIYRVSLRHECFAKLYFRDGQSNQLSLTAEQADSVVREISLRIPWVICGYDAKVLEQWRKRRSELLAQVERQRNEVL